MSMKGTKQGGKVRVGIAGLDHWYIGLDAARSAAAHPDVELVAVAHRDAARARETAARFGAGEATTEYMAVASRDDLDILVTACPSSENAVLCLEAARRKTHIISVKPIAMTRQEAATIKEAVERAGIVFISWESQYRLRPAYRQIKGWLEEGRIGRPLSALYVLRCGVPRQVWPGVEGQTWWLDPRQVPGGGWLDHAIYTIDTLRWLFGAEVVSAGGVVSALTHTDLPPSIEDFGLATLAFDGGQVAALEVTWTGAPGAFYSATQIVGSEGALVLDTRSPGRVALSGRVAPFSGWIETALPGDGDGPMESMVAALRDGAALPAGVDDACRNLEACLTFYEAARVGTTKQIRR